MKTTFKRTLPRPLSALWVLGVICLGFLSTSSLLLASTNNHQGESKLSDQELFDKGNQALANDAPQKALDYYFQIVDRSGSNVAIAQNIIAASKQANQPGAQEWGEQTVKLHRAEWGVILAAISMVAWAVFFAFSIWKRWRWKRILFISAFPILCIVGGLWAAHRWMPPANDAIIIYGSDPAAQQKKDSDSDKNQASTSKGSSEAPHSMAKLLISPFEGAEISGTLPTGTHVIMDPKQPSSEFKQITNHYVHVTDPTSNLQGWLPRQSVRRIGE